MDVHYTLPLYQPCRSTMRKTLWRYLLLASLMVLLAMLDFYKGRQLLVTPGWIFPFEFQPPISGVAERQSTLMVQTTVEGKSEEAEGEKDSSSLIEANKTDVKNNNRSPSKRPSRFCSWKSTLRPCERLLSRHRIKHRPLWFFMGDSNMWLMYTEMQRRRERNWGWTVQRNLTNACNHSHYFGFDLPQETIYPNYSLGEGPTSKETGPLCSDLRWAFNMRMGKGERFAEFLVVEFARDVESPSLTTRTTQESVEKYMARDFQNRTDDIVCVVNTGLHDMYVPNITVGIFVNNLHDYIGKLSRVCGSIIWVSLGATMDHPWYPQRIFSLIGPESYTL